jgi:hypothetical protein
MSAFRITFYLCLLFCTFLVHSKPELNPQENVIVASASAVSEGFITLSFEGYPKEEPVHIQISSDPQFQNLVRDIKLKAQSQVHLSGFNDGDYYARIVPIVSSSAASSADQSTMHSTHFKVEHRDLKSATLLFGLGAALFVILVVSLFRFTRKNI